MKVFISWSKDSREFAGVLNDVLRKLFDSVTTFYSPDIPAGEQWLAKIEEELTDTNFGIICVSRLNQKEQWLNYEAGALSRQVDDRRKRLGVLLLDIDDTSDVEGPYKSFQMKMANKDGFTLLMKSLNDIGPQIREDTLQSRIDSEWSSLEESIASLKSEARLSNTPPDRPMEEKVDEMLRIVRDFDKALIPGAFSPSTASSAERQTRREFITKLYKMARGRNIHYEFRSLDEMTDVLDANAPLSRTDKDQIDEFYHAFFGEDAKRLLIMDLVWKNENAALVHEAANR